MKTKTGTPHIRLRGNIYHLNYRVPKHLIPLVGKEIVQHSLKTDSLKEAKRIRDSIIREYTSLAPLNPSQTDKEAMLDLIPRIRRQYNSIATDVDAEAFNSMWEVSEGTMKANPVYTNAVLNVTVPNSPVITITAKETLSGATRTYLEAVKGKSISYLNRVSLSLKLFTSYLNCPDIELDSIQRQDVHSFMNNVLETKHTKTVRNYLSCLASTYSDAYNRGSVTGNNPFLNHKIYRKDATKKYKPFTSEQWAIYYPAVVKSASTDARKLLFPIALLTGMRLNEILGLTCSDIKQAEGIWYIDLKPNSYRTLKNDSSERKIPIHDSLLNNLLALKENSSNNMLFPEVAKIISKDKTASISKWLSRTRDKCIESEQQSFHSLRGMFITFFEQADVIETTTSRLTGHVIKTMTYGTYSDGVDLHTLKKALNVGIACNTKYPL